MHAHSYPVVTLVAAVFLLAPSLTVAQEPISACHSQQALEQTVKSGGQLMPEGCRNLAITSIDSDVGRLCVIDFSGGDQGILQKLRDAALPEQWWVRCEDLDR